MSRLDPHNVVVSVRDKSDAVVRIDPALFAQALVNLQGL